MNLAVPLIVAVWVLPFETQRAQVGVYAASSAMDRDFLDDEGFGRYAATL